MRFQILTLLIAIFCACALAVKNVQKPIIISFPDPNTPQSTVDKAMEVLREAGGVVTHEYTLFKGFAAKASDATIEAVKALGGEFLPLIEEDQVVSIDGTVANGKST